MFVMGDEVRRTQRGNNNAYCHDNELSWFDWTLLEKHAEILRFVQLLNARRVMRDIKHERQRISIRTMLDAANKAWHGVKLNEPDWGDNSHSVALCTELSGAGLRVDYIFNAYWEPLDFELPPPAGKPWRRWIDTALDAPDDIVPWQDAPPVAGDKYTTAARSVVILYAGSGQI
jgi:glycogen operon protein